MRLFIAVPLPAAAQEAAGHLLTDLTALDWPVRWVRAEGMHLTLKFFGEVTSDRVESIEEMLQFATEGMRPIELAMLSGGAFPSGRHPRVLRIELSAGSDLELLQDRLERGGERIGFPPEGRPFRPHLTLGRVREGDRLPPGAIERLHAIPPGPTFLVDRIVLFESRLSPQGPAYSVRLEQRLG